MFKRLRTWLRTSPHVHIRQGSPETIKDLVALLDRFLDGELAYQLEWDDFISWDSNNPDIELIRKRIAQTEPLFFSKVPSDRIRAAEMLLEERNRAAAIIAQAPRESPLSRAVKYDFNVLEIAAGRLIDGGRYHDALAIYFHMADGDPSLDAGYLAKRIAQCYAALGERHAAKYWYGRALEENPVVNADCVEARKKLGEYLDRRSVMART